MGVPAFFKWLVSRYPKIIIEALENAELGFNLNKIIKNNIGIDESIPSIDNLYFDMNGIIHPCAHPEDRESPYSISEIFNSIFDYCDKIIRIIRPKKLIYMAIDGVAPRAKMNQQRSRRFRTALEAQQNEKFSKKVEKEWKDKGLLTENLENKNSKKLKFDSNCITPGTDFLDQCSKALRTYIQSRINNDPLWKDLNVILSDASVPGEGEHKILDFIRTQRTYDSYNPNTCHCIYGADADLIMLSLIMHEPHFCVLRESIDDNGFVICDVCKKHGHVAENCNIVTGKFIKNKATENQISKYNKEQIDKTKFSLLKVDILREYLELEFQNLIDLGFIFERMIDDFVFLCFLVGNDFLPNMPSLKIREGGLDALMYLYKKILPEMNEYLTNGKGQLNLKQCEILFQKLSLVEDEFFQREMQSKMNDRNFRKNNPVLFPTLNAFRNIPNINNSQNEKENKYSKIYDKGNTDEIDLVDTVLNIKNIQKEEQINKIFNSKNLKTKAEEIKNQIIREEINEENNKMVREYEDKIQLGIPGWKDRYYKQKFHVSPQENKQALDDLKDKIKQFYIEGLRWVFEYYYNGCISWSWFYPFHYAPFASDLTNLTELNIQFDTKSRPFYAFEQLLSVLPPYSADALPPCFRNLMRDPFSPIADFYPTNIKLDINNQPYSWMGVNLIPFVDAERIQKVVKNIIDKDKLNEREKKLNERGDNILIKRNEEFYFVGEFSLNKEMNSYNTYLKEDRFIKNIHPGNVEKDKSMIYIFRKIKNDRPHCSEILKGVEPHKKCIIEDNIDCYPRTRKGKEAIQIVKNVLGYKYDDVEADIMNEIWDEKYGNNNRAIELDPMAKQLLMKKRYQEREKASNMLSSSKNMKNKDKKETSGEMNKNQNNKNSNTNRNNNNNSINLDEDEDRKSEQENKETKKKKDDNNKKKNNEKKEDLNTLMSCIHNILKGNKKTK